MTSSKLVMIYLRKSQGKPKCQFWSSGSIEYIAVYTDNKQEKHAFLSSTLFQWLQMVCSKIFPWWNRTWEIKLFIITYITTLLCNLGH